MHYQLKLWMLLFFIFPCCASALSINDHFQRSVDIENHYSQPILVTDPSEPLLQNKLLSPHVKTRVTYKADQWTVPSGQTFSRSINIYSAVDDKLICTVTSQLILTQNSHSVTLKTADLTIPPDSVVSIPRPTSTDESKCTTGTSTYLNDDGDQIFEFYVSVHD